METTIIISLPLPILVPLGDYLVYERLSFIKCLHAIAMLLILVSISNLYTLYAHIADRLGEIMHSESSYYVSPAAGTPIATATFTACVFHLIGPLEQAVLLVRSLYILKLPPSPYCHGNKQDEPTFDQLRDARFLTYIAWLELLLTAVGLEMGPFECVDGLPLVSWIVVSILLVFSSLWWRRIRYLQDGR